MDKGKVTYGAFALPGLANLGKKPFADGISRSRARGQDTSSNISARTRKTDEVGLGDDSVSLVDESGLFLPARTELSLEHLTKSRPRTHGRRSPSPSARRKSWREENSDSISKSDAVKLTAQTLIDERGKGSSPERSKRVPEYSNNFEMRERKYHKSKLTDKHGHDMRDVRDLGDLPPPLPSSPPPLDHFGNQVEMTNSTARKFPSAFSTKSTSNMSTDDPRVRSPGIKNTALKSAETTQENSISDNRLNILGESNRKDLSKTASTAVDQVRQASLDSVINPLEFQSPKYYRGSVELEKCSSTRRRRFKPVTIPDESESNNQPNINYTCPAPKNGEDRTFPRASASKNLFDSWLESSRERKQAGERTRRVDPHIALDMNRKDNENIAKKELYFSTSKTPRLKSNMVVEYDEDNDLGSTTVMGAAGIVMTETNTALSSKLHSENRDQFDSDLRMLPALAVGNDTGNKPTISASSEPDPEVFNQDPSDCSSNSGDMSDRDDILAVVSQLESTVQPSYVNGNGSRIAETIPEEHFRSNNDSVSAVEDLQEYYNEGVLDPDDESIFIEPPTQFYEDDVQVDRGDEVFAPPPMFAQPNDEDNSEKNSASTVLDEKFLSSSVDDNFRTGQCWSFEEMPEGLRPFHHTPLDAWSEDDTAEWMEYIGLGHFAQEFRNHHVDGKTLKTISYPLLEEIGITSEDEREIILSEIYQLSNPDEDDDIEQQIQDVLQGASEEDRDKVLAVLNALKSPEFNPLVDIPSTASSSPRDSEIGHVASDTGSISSSMTSGDDHTHDLGMPPPPPPPRWPDSPHAQQPTGTSGAPREKVAEGLGQEDSKRKGERAPSGKEKKKKGSKHSRKEKKSKGVGKLIDSLAHSSKFSKLFGSKKLNPTMQYLLHVGPQGILRIWPRALSEETNYCSFMVSMTTTSTQVVKLVLDKYDAIEDPRRFYISEVQLTKGGAHRDLLDNECPLLRQCRWPDPEKYRFELRCRDEGAIKMLFDLDGYEDDLDYRRLAVSSSTSCKEALELIVKKFELPGKTSDYFLVEVSEENEGDRQVVGENVYPLRLQMAWNEPDHVFRLCRLISGHTAHRARTNDVRLEASSAQYDDRADFHSTAHHEFTEEDVTLVQESVNLEPRQREDRRTEREPTVVSQSGDLSVTELDEVDAQRRFGRELKGTEFYDSREQREELSRREREVEQLEYDNKELLESLRELEEKRRTELEVRDREIERLYSRNSELSAKEGELEHMREKGEGIEGENLRGASSDESRLVEKIADLQQRHKELELSAVETEEVKRMNRELSKKVEEGLIAKQELLTVETQKQEMTHKIQDLQGRNEELQSGVSKEVESLRRENQALAMKAKDADAMKQNIIRLTAQLREIDSARSDSAELQVLREKVKTVALEKEQLVLKLEEMAKESQTTNENFTDIGELNLENITLVEKNKDVTDLKHKVDKLTEEVKENQLYREKYEELRDAENYTRKQLNNLESVAHAKDQRIKDYENKLKAMTQLVKDMEAKLEEQEQHRAYLDQLLPILKQRDPSLLHFMNSSLVSKEPDEWC